MRKTLITALVVFSILLAAAVGVVIYMENRAASDMPTEPSSVTTGESAADTQQTDAKPDETEPVETTEETLGFSLPTEDPAERAPEQTVSEEEQQSTATAPSADPDATFDPDENETPQMPVC